MENTNLPVAAQGAEVAFVIPNTEQLGQLKKMSADFSLTLKYKTADDWAAIKDKDLRAYYVGMKEIPNEKGELVTCAAFVSDKECFIAGQMLIVEAVRQLPINTPLSITYRGKQNNKSGEGATMKFDISVLK